MSSDFPQTQNLEKKEGFWINQAVVIVESTTNPSSAIKFGVFSATLFGHSMKTDCSGCSSCQLFTMVLFLQLERLPIARHDDVY